MKKSIKIIDDKRGIAQITTADERWYTRLGTDKVTSLPKVLFYASATWVAGYWPKGVEFYKYLANIGWDEAQAAKEAAGEKGSAVHAALEMILTGQEVRIDTKILDKTRSTDAEPVYRELTAEEIWCVRTFQDCVRELEDDYTVETLATEMTLISELLSIAGTLDWAMRLTPKPEGKNPLKIGGPTPYIVDFKTSKQIWMSHEIQLTIYRRIVENGENLLPVLNDNGTDTGRFHDISGLRTAIMLIGYSRNKDGYRFVPTEDRSKQLEIAQALWREDNEGKTPGLVQREFPIVLSPAKPAPRVDDAPKTTPAPERGTRTKRASSK